MVQSRSFREQRPVGHFCLRASHWSRCALWLGLLTTALVGAPAMAEDWPAYQHDAARSGITSEQLVFPLAEAWVFQPRFAPQPAWEGPKAQPVEGILELRRYHFDDAFQVAVAEGLVFFGSSSENKLFCLDAASGSIRWTRLVGGPIRLAPTWADGLVYVACDDGYAYCFEAKTGQLRWRFHAAPEERRVLGHGRMISLWPLRGGVLVDKGVAYLTAGIFPAEGIFLYALDAKTGRVIWRNDTCGETPQSGISPQGYLLASATTLYAPLGRVSPAAFDRQTGRLKYQTYFGKTVGGSYALLHPTNDAGKSAAAGGSYASVAGEEVYTGTEELVAYQGQTRDLFATFPGRRIVVAPQVAYLATGTELVALDRVKYPAISRRLRALRSRRQQLQEVPAARRTEAQRQELESLAAQIQKAQEEAAATTLWRLSSTHCEAMILAGRTLVAGGAGEVMAVDTATGRPVWRAKVDGVAKGLAVAGGRLVVSTDRGPIYGFTPGGPKTPQVVREPADSEPATAPAAAFVERAAEAILRQSGVRRGYCLVLGVQRGELAKALARQSELMIYCVAPDDATTDRVRQMLDRAGLYGARVSADTWPLDRVPYADYFANLVVSETALFGGPLPPAGEVLRMLKPEGGVAMLGQPEPDAAARQAGVRPLSAEALRQWLAAAPASAGYTMEHQGPWVQIRRGAIPGGGQWTHLYGNPGNTGCGNDRALRCPLGVLWFGQPGPAQMVNRHARAAGPLAAAGRLFVQGENVVMAYDAYNGLKLWEERIAGAKRENASHDGSNLAADDRSLFVAVGDQCLRLDAQTGKRLAVYDLAGPPSAGKRWGIVATSDGLLLGSRSPRTTVSQAVFAIDLASGKPRWVYQGMAIQHNTVAVAGGRVFLIDAPATAGGAGSAAGASKEKAPADLRTVVALDLQTSEPLWHIPLDTRDCGGGNLALMSDGRYVVVFGVYLDGHYWKQFFAGEFAPRRVVVLSAQDGKVLWSKAVGYRVRPVLIGDTLHTEPWAFDVRTGQPRLRINPITGTAEPFQFARPGHHCGLPIGTANALFFRSWCLGYYDLVRDAGTAHFGAQRPGCWINFIPAGGLLLMPEASAGCMCAFPNMCSVAFQPVQRDKAFTYFSLFGPTTPVQRLGLNFGAAGDRKDDSGQLWLAYPRPSGSLVLPLPVSVTFLPGGTYVQRNSAYTPIAGDPRAWLFASAARGIRQCSIPLLGPGDGAAKYRIRLAFSDPDNDKPGRRVFDVKVQGQTALENLDVVGQSGASDRGFWREITGVVVRDRLVLEFIPKSPKPEPEEAPILQAIEIQRQEVLELGCSLPALVLTSLEPKQQASLELSNQRSEAFEGTLEVAGPAGIALSAGATQVRLEPDGRLRIPLQAALAGQPAVGEHTYRLRLVARNGAVALERTGKVEYLGRRGRTVLRPVEDASATRRYPTQNKGSATELLVDGGDRKMGDTDHAVAYLKFRLDLPGKPVAARLRLFNAGNPSGSAGRVCLVEGPWSEKTLTYTNRPKIGSELAVLGNVAERQAVEKPIPVEALRQGELSLAIDPTSTDGVDYFSREGQNPPELIVEYELP